MLILGDVGLQIRLSKGFSSVRNIILIGEKINSHRWEMEFPSVGQDIPIGGNSCLNYIKKQKHSVLFCNVPDCS